MSKQFIEDTYQGRSVVEQKMLRAMQHLVRRNHDFKTSCFGCLEAAAFLTIPGYQGSEEPLTY